MIKHLRYDGELGVGYSLCVSDGTCRYVLGKQYKNKQFLLVVGVNPSTALVEETPELDEKTGYLNMDRTTTQIDKYATMQGYGWLLINLHPWISTKPKDFPAEDYLMTRENNRLIQEYVSKLPIAKVWCAWGESVLNLPNPLIAVQQLQNAIAGIPAPIVARGVTKDGHPRHPLYLSQGEPEVPFDLHHYVQSLERGIA